MSVEIKHKNPRLVPLCDVEIGSFFYFYNTLYVKTNIALSPGTCVGAPVGDMAVFFDPIITEKSAADVLVQPVNVCIEIR